jgi:uncharacterized protein YraI
MASSDLFDAFNDCIDRLNGGQGLEDCLRAHPQYADRLRPLLETAILVQRARPAIPPGAQARVRAQVLRATPPPTARLQFAPSGLALAAASVLVIGFVVAMFLMSRRTPGPSLRPELTATLSATATPTLVDTATIAPSATPTTPAPTNTATLSATPTHTVTATVTPSPTATVTPGPTVTATAPFTMAPAQTCLFTVGPTSINLRSGPGTGYTVVGYGFAGDMFTVTARHTSGLWFQIARTQGEAWVAASVGTVSGDCATLPTLDTPLREGTGPTATVTPVPGGGTAPTPPPGGGVSATPDDDGGDDKPDDHGGDDGHGDDSKDDDSHDDPNDD